MGESDNWRNQDNFRSSWSKFSLLSSHGAGYWVLCVKFKLNCNLLGHIRMQKQEYAANAHEADYRQDNAYNSGICFQLVSFFFWQSCANWRRQQNVEGLAKLGERGGGGYVLRWQVRSNLDFCALHGRVQPGFLQPCEVHCTCSLLGCRLMRHLQPLCTQRQQPLTSLSCHGNFDSTYKFGHNMKRFFLC